MTTLDGLAHGLAVALQPSVLIYSLLGAVLGTLVGVLPGIVGSIQAIETIKLILGLGDPLVGRLLAYDSLEQSFREYKVQVDPTNEITYANRDRIQVAELEGQCLPLPLQAPPG